MQLAIVHQQHGRHGSELLGARGKTEVSVRVDFPKRTQIGYAITTLKDYTPIFEDNHGCAGGTRRFNPREYLIDLFGLDWAARHTDLGRT
jgi:hypothetical protein